MLAASGWPKMPNTPHSSLNLSCVMSSISLASILCNIPGKRTQPTNLQMRLRYAPDELLFNRGRPELLEFGNRQVDYRASADGDSQSISTRLADDSRRNAGG